MPNDPIDIHVGARVRLRRKQLRVSQSVLADALGLTFQQVQKYERGSNRISASMLVKAARKLEVAIPYFFEGLEDLPGGRGDPVFDARAIGALTLLPELVLVDRLSVEQRRALATIINSMAGV